MGHIELHICTSIIVAEETKATSGFWWPCYDKNGKYNQELFGKVESNDHLKRVLQIDLKSIYQKGPQCAKGIEDDSKFLSHGLSIFHIFKFQAIPEVKILIT